MSLTPDQFLSCIKNFETTSNKLEDGWSIRRVPGIDCEDFYLVKIVYESVVLQKTTRLVCFEYHIIYSYSYSVPVLYFNACFDDGRLLSIDDIIESIHATYKEQFCENKWSMVTQQEHPFTRTPFFMVHPCNTENFLKPVLSGSSKINPLVTWLSVVAPLVNLKLNSSYGLEYFDIEEVTK